jgi:hypothetical protein
MVKGEGEGGGEADTGGEEEKGGGGGGHKEGAGATGQPNQTKSKEG